MGGFGVALDALGGRCIFMSELEGKVMQLLLKNCGHDLQFSDYLSQSKNVDSHN